MKTHPFLSVSLAAALLLLSAKAASAVPLVLNNVSAGEAAARLSARYGASIVLKANTGRHVNVAIEDADDASTRLQTVNALANALHLDFTKTIVVSKTTASEAQSGVTDFVAVDTEASIPFGRTTLPTREAITLIAGVDDAFAQIAGAIGGVVTLSKPTLTVSQAEEEVAKQTGTTWRSVYVLTPRSLTSWVASPLLFFPDRQREAQQRREADREERQTAQEQAVAYQAYQQALAQRQAALQTAANPVAMGRQATNGQSMNGQAMNGMGYYPNGYGPYGNADQPYQNSSLYSYGGYANGGYSSEAYGSGNGMETSGNSGGNFPNYIAGGGQ